MTAIAMVFVCVQALRCGVVSGLRLEALAHKLQAVQAIEAQAQAHQDDLKDKITRYSSPMGVEEMARERLGLVGQDEVLVRVYPVSVAHR